MVSSWKFVTSAEHVALWWKPDPGKCFVCGLDRLVPNVYLTPSCECAHVGMCPCGDVLVYCMRLVCEAYSQSRLIM